MKAFFLSPRLETKFYNTKQLEGMRVRRWKVVVTDYEYEDLRFEEAVFAGLPIELVAGNARTEEEVIAIARDADGILNQYAPLTARVIEALERCKVISRYGVGVNTVDLDMATQKGIYVANVPDYCWDEVADHALALILSCARKVVQYNNWIKRDKWWDYKLGRPIYRLRGMTLGVLGFGRIPQNLVGKARAFGFRILVHDPYVPVERIREHGAEPVELAELLRESDFLSIHVPLTNETRGMIGRQELRLMKPTAYVINTGRGGVIDEAALVEALEAGWIAGAALDVVESEPISPDHPLLRLDNVILTPHVAWYSETAEADMRTKAARSVVEVLQGNVPTYLVNREVLKTSGRKA